MINFEKTLVTISAFEDLNLMKNILTSKRIWN